MTRLGPHVAASGILVAGLTASLWLNYPGHLEYDSIAQLLEGRNREYGNWHPPVMSWLLGLGDAVVPGAGLFVVFNSVLAYGSLIAILWLTRQISWLAVFVALACIFLPQMLLIQGIVWKDILFADATVSGFVFLAFASIFWRRDQNRRICLALAAIMLTLATLTRQNGMLVLPCAIGVLGVVAWRNSESNRLRSGFAYAAAFAAASAGLGMLATAGLATRVTHPPGAIQMFKEVQVYDLVGAVRLKPNLPLPILDRKAPHLESLIRSGGVQRYTADTIVGITTWPPLENAGLAAPRAVSLQWQDLIVHHTWLYVRSRAEVFGWLFLSPDPDQMYIFTTGVDGDHKDMATLGIKVRKDARDKFLDAYSDKFIQARILHPIFAIVAAICGMFMMYRRNSEDLVFLGMLGSTALFSLSFFIISVSSDYRYLYLIDLSAIGSCLYVSATFRLRRASFVSVNAMTSRWPRLRRA